MASCLPRRDIIRAAIPWWVIMRRDWHSILIIMALAVPVTVQGSSAQTATRPDTASQNPQNQSTTARSAATSADAKPTSSLGDIARKFRAEKSRETAKASVVYTNENLPSGGGISVTGATPGTSGAAGESGTSLVGGKEAPAGEHGEAYFRSKMAELKNRLQTDQRELSVLKQKLSQNSMVYYPDPYKTLMQEYTRSDVTKGADQIDQKEKQIEADQQAIQDLQAQLRREGGEPSWLLPSQGTPSTIPGMSVPSKGAKPGAQEYQRQRLTDAQKALQHAQEQERLAEDELGLLQLQQARELDQTVQEQLTTKIAAKKQEIQKWQAAVKQAQQQVQDLQKKVSQKAAARQQ